MQQRKSKQGFVLIITTLSIVLFISVTFSIVALNRIALNDSEKEIYLLDLKAELEAYAMYIVAHVDVSRMTSTEYKKKSNFMYLIEKYEEDYIIYLKYIYDSSITYYMVFNNLRTNENYDQFTILKEGYLLEGENELES